MPYLELFVVEQYGWNDLLAHDPPEAWITKHLCDVYGELIKEFIYERGLVVELPKEGVYRESFDLHNPQDSPLEGGHSIVSEVVTVLLIDKLRNPF